MAKKDFKPGNMLYPLPAVLLSVADKEGNSNLMTVAWVGTICSDPPMVSVSVKPERFSHHMIEETGEFVINLTTEKLCFATDYCGVKSGKDINKWKAMKLTKVPGTEVSVPMVGESPVNIECRVKEKKELGSHDMFIAEVVAVHVEENFMDDRGGFHLNDARPLVYSHGRYFATGEDLGFFGFSVQREKSRYDN